MAVFQITLDVPDKYCSLLGKVLVHWSFQERLLADLTYAILNVGPKHGRVSVRSPRASEHVTMIQQLLSLEKIKCDDVDLAKLAESLRALENVRDLLAHSVWFVDPKTNLPAVQNLSGNWKPHPKGPKVARRINPQGVVVDETEFHKIIDALKQSIRVTLQAHGEIVHKLEALRKKTH